jgi:hypothetical protein
MYLSGILGDILLDMAVQGRELILATIPISSIQTTQDIRLRKSDVLTLCEDQDC